MLELSHNGAEQAAVEIKDSEGGRGFRFRAADRNVSLRESIFSPAGVLNSHPVFSRWRHSGHRAAFKVRANSD